MLPVMDSCFAGDDGLYDKGFLLFLFWDMVVVPAYGAADEAVAGLGNDLVLGLLVAHRAQNGDKH